MLRGWLLIVSIVLAPLAGRGADLPPWYKDKPSGPAWYTEPMSRQSPSSSSVTHPLSTDSGRIGALADHIVRHNQGALSRAGGSDYHSGQFDAFAAAQGVSGTLLRAEIDSRVRANDTYRAAYESGTTPSSGSNRLASESLFGRPHDFFETPAVARERDRVHRLEVAAYEFARTNGSVLVNATAEQLRNYEMQMSEHASRLGFGSVEFSRSVKAQIGSSAREFVHLSSGGVPTSSRRVSDVSSPPQRPVAFSSGLAEMTQAAPLSSSRPAATDVERRYEVADALVKVYAYLFTTDFVGTAEYVHMLANIAAEHGFAELEFRQAVEDKLNHRAARGGSSCRSLWQ